MAKILLILLLAVGWPAFASATPAFSRQTGASCRLCHFQGMHSLDKYGRDFLRSGFRETREMKERRRKLGPVHTNYERGDEAIFVAMQGISSEVCPRHMSEK